MCFVVTKTCLSPQTRVCRGNNDTSASSRQWQCLWQPVQNWQPCDSHPRDRFHEEDCWMVFALEQPVRLCPWFSKIIKQFKSSHCFGTRCNYRLPFLAFFYSFFSKQEKKKKRPNCFTAKGSASLCNLLVFYRKETILSRRRSEVGHVCLASGRAHWLSAFCQSWCRNICIPVLTSVIVLHCSVHHRIEWGHLIKDIYIYLPPEKLLLLLLLLLLPETE